MEESGGEVRSLSSDAPRLHHTTARSCSQSSVLIEFLKVDWDRLSLRGVFISGFRRDEKPMPIIRSISAR